MTLCHLAKLFSAPSVLLPHLCELSSQAGFRFCSLNWMFPLQVERGCLCPSATGTEGQD